MPTTTIRIEQSTHKKLRALASQTGDTIPHLVAVAVEEYDRRLFWDQVNAEFKALRRNLKSWKRELQERAAWNATLADGLQE